MKHATRRRWIAAALCLVMFIGQLPKSTATSQQADTKVVWQKVDNDLVSAEFLPEGYALTEEQPPYDEEDLVRVSIVLKKKPTLSVYPGQNVAQNVWATGYRSALERQQDAMAASISSTVLNNEPLDVVWNLTLAANAISANVPYGTIEAIKAVDGVADVFLERRYDPCVASGNAVDPKMSISTAMTETTQAWATGFTGAGTRVAIIDTGLDTEHQSVSDAAFQYSLGLLAEENGMTKDAFLSQKDLLDQEEIGAVLTQLHAYSRSYSSAEAFYLSSKIPFGFNYVDGNFQITHMTDSAGDHGSHVAGIAAANRFLPESDGSFSSALDTVKMVGAAPDAQILVMKVFGAGGGAYDSDYMAAVEDAIVLGCDTVNLSLGSSFPGLTDGEYYENIMEMLGRSNTIATMAASNSGYWTEQTHTPTRLPYGEDVMFQTAGSPGTYTNSLCVASVDNDGTVGFGFYVPDKDGHFIAYNEPSGYNRNMLNSLDTSGYGTTYDFIWIDGIGQESDYAGIDLSGKVVFCSRGEIQFSEKAAIAVNKGAIAVVVYNNMAGSINMNLDDYTGTAPCVSISKSDGEAVRSTTTDCGTYRTGRILITGGATDSSWDSDYYVMSSFSSWGVPGDLSMKPEITAPGGNIWSLKGTESSHDQYQVMGGTSMAAPQMAGIGALVMQAITEREISQTGLTDRALAQSLMMSTAVPMKDAKGAYYSILQQGAGLVNAGAATSADAYITVEGMADGKVKVELGDDPNRTGVYDFTFTIHNLDGADRSYILSADVFTQDTVQSNGFSWQALNTQALDAAVTTFAVADTAAHDFDGNGIVEITADGQALLAYASGHWESISCLENADFSGDGEVSTYDAHLFLNQSSRGGQNEIPAGGTVNVPANSSIDISVNITLDSAQMQSLLQHCPNGVYLQAYVFATAQADGEGAVGTAHSIPVLGFYGNWSDPSMYDKGSYQYYQYRLYGDSVPYTPYLGSNDVNTYMVTYGSNPSISYALGGNPVDLKDQYEAPVQLDDTYLESRNALNNQNGDMVYSLRHAAIRNSIATRFTATDANTGVVYFTDEQLSAQYSAYYNPSTDAWECTNDSPYIGWSGTDQNGYLLPENTVVNLVYTRAPEYYENEDGTIRWGDLGSGASFTTQVTIDNTAPELISASAANGDLTVTVHDNQYVAAVVLLDPLGQRQLSYAGGNQTEKNVQTDVVLPVDDIVGKSFMLQLFDYAMNASTYEVSIEGMGPKIHNDYTGYDKDSQTWYGINESGAAGVYALDSRSIYAAERVDDLVFAVDSTQENTANLYVMPADDLAKIDLVGSISAPYPDETFYIADMAYHYPDGTMYFVYFSSHSDMGGCYGLATVDLLTGRADFESYGPLGADLRGLAIDENGNFYGVGDNYRLYTYTKTTYGAPQNLGFSTGSLAGSPTRISLTWDAKKDELVMADHRSEGRTLYRVNAQTGALTTVSASAPGTLWGLHVDSGLSSGQNFGDSSTPTHVFFTENSVKLLQGATCQLSAAAYPWTLTNRAVSWSSNDSGIASVDQNGLVTGNSLGTCTITATSVLDASVSATCTVEVTKINADLNAIICNAGSNAWWSSFNTDAPSSYQTRKQSDAGLVTAVHTEDGWIYGATWDEKAAASDLYRVNAETLEETYIGKVGRQGYYYEVVDLADAPNLGNGNQYIVGVSSQNIIVMNRTNGEIVGVVSSEMGLNAHMVGITYAGKLEHPQNGTYDTYYAIDYYGKVYWVGIQVESVEANNVLTLSLLSRTADYVVAQTNLDTDYAYYYNSLHYTRDNSGTPFLFWSYYEWGKAVQMIAIDADKTGAMAYLGTFPRYVYPVGGLMDSDVPAFSQTAAEAVTVQGGVNDIQALETAGSSPVRNTAGELVETAAEETAPEAVFRRSSASAVVPAGNAVIGGQENGSGANVSVTLTAQQATTNGLLEITYDPEILDFVSDQGNTRLYSGRKEADGQITLGYAVKDACSPGTVLSRLSFTAKQAAVETDITVTVVENGSQTEGRAQVTIPVIRVPKTHTVTFNLNGGDGTAPAVQTVFDGAPAEKPDDPTREGWTFLYWSAFQNGGEYNFDAPVTGDMTLYAIWQELTPETTTPETEPTEVPTEPESETKPTEPETKPTEPETKPTEPETKPTEPETKPTEPETKPTEPETKPTEPETKPTEPETKPTEPEETKPQVPECDKDESCELSQFEDIKVDDWYHDGIHFCVDQGIMNGMGEGKFAPNEATTRAQLVTMLYRLAGKPGTAGKTEPFADVSKGDWYYDAIVWAYHNKVVNGISETEFAPNANVTREQVATILYRYLGSPAGTGKLAAFPDVAKVSPYAVDALTWAVGAKLINGVARPGGTSNLDPAGNATRAQIATILMRYLTGK